MNFDNIEYLKQGNAKQNSAYHVLISNNIIGILQPYAPLLVGTIPINIDINNSDLDIICYTPDLAEFKPYLSENFSNQHKYTITETTINNEDCVVANFYTDGFEIEIFGQNTPVKQQRAYRHMIIEHKLLEKYGEEFRQKVIELKRSGIKTEPAFAMLLGLQSNDPYTELLNYKIE